MPIGMSSQEQQTLIRYHLRVGWWGLLFFLSLGGVLELLHGLKIGFYLDVSNETRRLLFTLSHAHGALLAMLHLCFAFTVSVSDDWQGASRSWASRCLTASLALIPGGFLLGGVFIHSGDPGLGILLLPPGVVLLTTGVLLAARGVDTRRS